MGDHPAPSSPEQTDTVSSSKIGLTATTISSKGASVKDVAMHPKQHGQPNLAGLPDELMDLIFSYLESPPKGIDQLACASRSDFWSLCLASRNCNRAATPYLYSSFEHELFKEPHRLHCFLRSIITTPKLATYVRCVSLRDQSPCESFSNMMSWRKWARHSYRPRVSDADRALFELAARELQLGRADALDAIAEHEEAQAALLLSCATQLTELRLTIPNLGKDRILLEILKETTDRGTALRHLRCFTAIYYNFDEKVDGGFELAPISSLFRLPRIAVVRGMACLEPEGDAFRGFDCPEGSSSVEEIDFRRSSICPKAMSLMLGACRALRRFSCDWGSHTVGWSEISFRSVGRALRKQKASLEALTLDLRKHYHSWPEHDDLLIEPLGSFAGFARLAYIEAPPAALVGWHDGNVDGFPPLHEILPACLEKLVINQSSPGITEQLERLAEVCAATCPHLREITLRETHDEEAERKMQDLFDRNGAEVHIRFLDGEEVDHFA